MTAVTITAEKRQGFFGSYWEAVATQAGFWGGRRIAKATGRSERAARDGLKRRMDAMSGPAGPEHRDPRDWDGMQPKGTVWVNARTGATSPGLFGGRLPPFGGWSR